MKDYKRIVFLDIDGVMASTPFFSVKERVS